MFLPLCGFFYSTNGKLLPQFQGDPHCRKFTVAHVPTCLFIFSKIHLQVTPNSNVISYVGRLQIAIENRNRMRCLSCLLIEISLKFMFPFSSFPEPSSFFPPSVSLKFVPIFMALVIRSIRLFLRIKSD